MYVTLGLYTGDDGKENGNYCMTKGSLEGLYRDCSGILEKKMESTVV